MLRDIEVHISIYVCIHFKSRILRLDLKNYIRVCLVNMFVYFPTLLPYILHIQYGIKVHISIHVCIHFKSKILRLDLKIIFKYFWCICFVYFLTLLPYILSIQYGGDPEPIHQAEFTRYISKIFPEESIVFIIY